MFVFDMALKTAPINTQKSYDSYVKISDLNTRLDGIISKYQDILIANFSSKGAVDNGVLYFNSKDVPSVLLAIRNEITKAKVGEAGLVEANKFISDITTALNGALEEAPPIKGQPVNVFTFNCTLGEKAGKSAFFIKTINSSPSTEKLHNMLEKRGLPDTEFVK